MGDVDWTRTATEGLACLKELLRIDTSNPPGNERPAADLIAAALAREGIPAQILESAPGRASLVARLAEVLGRLQAFPAPPAATDEHDALLAAAMATPEDDAPRRVSHPATI